MPMTASTRSAFGICWGEITIPPDAPSPLMRATGLDGSLCSIAVLHNKLFPKRHVEESSLAELGKRLWADNPTVRQSEVFIERIAIQNCLEVIDRRAADDRFITRTVLAG